MLRALETGDMPAITGWDGRRTIELITAIYKSGATGQPALLPIERGDPFYTAEGMIARVPRFFEKGESVVSLGNGEITLGSSYGGA